MKRLSRYKAELLLIYLFMFGGVHGWYISLVRRLDYGLLLTSSIYLCWELLQRKRLSGWLKAASLFVVVQMVSGFINGTESIWIAWRILTLSGYMGLGLAIQSGKLEATASSLVRTGWLLFPFSIVGWSLIGFRRLDLFDNPNVTAAILALLLPAGASIENSKSRKLWHMLGAIALLATGSRGAAVAYLVALIYLHSKSIAIGLGVGGLFTGFLATRAGFRFLGMHNDNMRLITYLQAICLLLSKPLLGAGPYSIMIQNPDIFHAHNMLLTIASDTGIVGIVTFALAIGQVGRLPRPRWANAALVGWLVFQLVEDTFWYLSVGGLVTILSMAISSSDTRKTR